MVERSSGQLSVSKWRSASGRSITAVHSIVARRQARQWSGSRGSGSDRVRIYTKTGDDGSTGLLGSGRVSKDDLRVEVYGTVDELNAALGLARAHGLDSRRRSPWSPSSRTSCSSSARHWPIPPPTGRSTMPSRSSHVAGLESAIDGLEAELEPADAVHPAWGTSDPPRSSTWRGRSAAAPNGWP